MLAAFSRISGALLREFRGLERPVFGLLRSSNARPIRSLRFRLFKAWGAGLDDDRAIHWATLPGGLRLMVDVRDFFGITYIEPRAIEPLTTNYLLKHLRRGDVFADIGANVGYMTVLAARRVGPDGAVWSFEPNPRLVRLIRETVVRNGFEGWVHPVEIALAEGDDPDRPFYVSRDPTNSGLSSLTPDADHRALGRMDMGAPLRVPVTTLDRFTAERGIERLDAVKIDVEGAEHLVIEGMSQSLARLRPRFVVCETALGSPAVVVLEQSGYRGRMLEPMRADGGWGNMLFEPLGNVA
jgi:FkbM family methyltransferase